MKRSRSGSFWHSALSSATSSTSNPNIPSVSDQSKNVTGLIPVEKRCPKKEKEKVPARYYAIVLYNSAGSLFPRQQQNTVPTFSRGGPRNARASRSSQFNAKTQRRKDAETIAKGIALLTCRSISKRRKRKKKRKGERCPAPFPAVVQPTQAALARVATPLHESDVREKGEVLWRLRWSLRWSWRPLRPCGEIAMCFNPAGPVAMTEVSIPRSREPAGQGARRRA